MVHDAVDSGGTVRVGRESMVSGGLPAVLYCDIALPNIMVIAWCMAHLYEHIDAEDGIMTIYA